MEPRTGTASGKRKSPGKSVPRGKSASGVKAADKKAAPKKSARAKPAASRATVDNSDKKFSKSLDATQLYLNEIGYSPLLTPEEEVYFSRLARKGEESGRKRMIESNLRLVVKIARR